MFCYSLLIHSPIDVLLKEMAMKLEGVNFPLAVEE